ncbi:MAG: nucleotidyltransferase, partial [Blastocatellia bacterium]|nr:nucleotidyltransferase [Blastocatellia bacterium]
MATTILQGFNKLRSNLEITSLQESTVSTRQTNIRQVIESEMSVLDSFLTGSYKRSTMIAPLSGADIDIAVVLDPKYYAYDGHASLLDKVKRVLRKTYTKTQEISRNGQAVTITFTDFKVDVVPSFHRQGGGYLIPDSVSKRWTATDPKKHVDIWSASNKAHNGDLIPLTKMLKGWNKSHSWLLRSFHLEALTLQILNNVTINSFPSGVRYVLDKARSNYKSVFDPAGYGGNLADYIDTTSKAEEIYKRLDSAYTKAV